MSDVIEYKCPSCNASMVFDSKSQHMKCPYCDTEMTVEEFSARRNPKIHRRPENQFQTTTGTQ